MAKAAKKAARVDDLPSDAGNRAAVLTDRDLARQVEAAETRTARAEDEGRLPESMAITNPAPATEMDSGSGAFMEPEIKAAIPVDHPSVENNPRMGTSAVQNGADFNDPFRRHPGTPGYAGQGLDRSVYGDVKADAPAKGGDGK